MSKPMSKRLRDWALALGCIAAGLAYAGDSGRVPKPAIVIDRPGQCVADAATMRREHPEMLKHHRDRTVHEGIRTREHSLSACVECHASARTGSVLGEQGFCQSCHAYAAVKLDCFECHASKPRPSGIAAAAPNITDGAKQ